MSIREIQAKTMLASVKQPDGIFGVKYNMNLYRGCQHRCIYCDSRSECYQIENFDGEVLVKVNAIELLEHEMPRKRIKGVIGTGSMNDPYMPVERQYQLTRRALELMIRFHFPVHIITKSDLVLRDIDLLEELNRIHAAVCITLTTTDDELGRKVEPFAPLPSRRLAAIATLAGRSIPVGVSLMPVLPFIEDNPLNLQAIVEQAAAHGATFIVPWFGMSLRDRQRAYFYAQLDRLFPGVRAQYEKRFGDRYEAPARDAHALAKLFYNLIGAFGIQDHIPGWNSSQPSAQLKLF